MTKSKAFQFAALFLVKLLFWNIACSREFPLPQSRKLADLTVIFSTEPEPPRVGENRLRVELLEASNRRVSDARVNFVYSIIPKKAPKGQPAAYFAGIQAQLGPEKIYTAPARLDMAGQWHVVVKVEKSGKLLPPVGFDILVE